MSALDFLVTAGTKSVEKPFLRCHFECDQLRPNFEVALQVTTNDADDTFLIQTDEQKIYLTYKEAQALSLSLQRHLGLIWDRKRLEALNG